MEDHRFPKLDCIKISVLEIIDKKEVFKNDELFDIHTF